MAKIYPKAPISSRYMTSKQETFTIWMKSLVCHSNGCTVFNSNGDIVYRVENYEEKCSNEVYLMDLHGQVLFTIRRKKYGIVSGQWDGYRWSSSNLKKEKPWFKVKKYCKFLMGDLACQVSIGHERLRIVRLAHKAAFRIVNNNSNGDIMAEVNQKQSSCGIYLGKDVLTVEYERGTACRSFVDRGSCYRLWFDQSSIVN